VAVPVHAGVQFHYLLSIFPLRNFIQVMQI